MGITYTVHRERRLFVTRFQGEISDAELILGYQILVADPRVQPGFNELADMSGEWTPDFTSIGMHRVHKIAEDFLADCPGGMRTAVVATRPLPFGLARMYELSNDESAESVKVFSDASRALEWLGLGSIQLAELHKDPI